MNKQIKILLLIKLMLVLLKSFPLTVLMKNFKRTHDKLSSLTSPRDVFQTNTLVYME